MGALWHPFADMGAVERDGEFVVARGDGRLRLRPRGQPLPRRDRRVCGSPTSATAVREIADAVAEQMSKVAAYSTFGDYVTEPTVALAERLAGIAPVPGSKIFFTSGGSDSVDTAAKLARRYWHEVGPAAQDDHRRPAEGLPRHARRRHRAGRHPRQPRGLRRAGARRRDRRVGQRRRPARDDRAARRRERRRVLLRAGDRRRRRLPAAGRLPRRGPQDLPRARHPVRRRRGGHRVRPDRRRVVRDRRGSASSPT